MSDDMPPQPPTTKLAAPTEREQLLAGIRSIVSAEIGILDTKMAIGLRDMEARMDAKVDGLGKRLDKAVQDWMVTDVRQERFEKRIDRVEFRVEDLEARTGRTSNRVREDSQHNLDQDAQLGLALAEIAEKDARIKKLEASAATKEDLKAVADEQSRALVASLTGAAAIAVKDPWVRRIGLALAGLALVAINAATNYFTAKATQQAPQTQGQTK